MARAANRQTPPPVHIIGSAPNPSPAPPAPVSLAPEAQPGAAQGGGHMDEPQHQWKPLSGQGGDIASSSAELRTGRGNKARAPPRTSIFESDTDSESEAPREIVHATRGKMANFDIWDPYPHRERINMTRIAPVAVGGKWRICHANVWRPCNDASNAKSRSTHFQGSSR